VATSLEVILKAGYAIASYAWLDIDPDVHATVSHRLTRLTHQYLQLFPPGAIRVWASMLPMDVRTISLELFAKTFLKGLLTFQSADAGKTLSQNPQGPRATWPDYRTPNLTSHIVPHGFTTMGESVTSRTLPSFTSLPHTPCPYWAKAC
jgi:hypothetical protein